MDEVVRTSSLGDATEAALQMHGVSLLSETERFITCVSDLMEADSPYYDLFRRQADEELLQPLVEAAAEQSLSALLAANYEIAEILTQKRQVPRELSRTFAEELVDGLSDYLGVYAGSIRCVRCGRRLPHDARFCPSCGLIVATASSPIPPLPPQPKDFLLPEDELEKSLGDLGFDRKEERPPDHGEFACCYAPMPPDFPFDNGPSGSGGSSGDETRDDGLSRSRVRSFIQRHNPFGHGKGKTS